ncbi:MULTISPECIES: hypothetical protein [Weeksella]|uniref:Outer membrane protein beta-barrel domain-containing protein n=1 Tax=Weeksella virosa (strain ATCC 43766 / DSM 16922 / JCM 21250 / CCUG 30538 / CDC 9751 / IAM 14551 / NBRC 16016 / NCTC 11634 / CL345/78) TaxID=865938 RepID=F0NYC2_WEEVC|nr:MULTISPECIES: hypothetical protein [Weeksella]ADX68119.1 hypothetical protein Weevi_1418 [Weeksella virosa DSM 16922]MDK7374897.1 hypothetical protein [Weeksella virosa]MDK7675460.1 hypothetical protein [Weeksella virosa]OFM83906.1 hypothetical protein HMPREF2660_10320 [Weeksella sp. HMSC059D05]SUP54430.1 Uncharacterised protein [Weeksella virosa]
MKKLVLATAVAVFGVVGLQAQSTGFEAGVHVGIPVGDVSDASNFNIGLDVAYLYPVAQNFRLGLASGYDHFVGKDNVDDFGFIPLAASAKFTPTQNFFVGADLGYAFATNDGMDGGFYYQPKVGYSGALVDVYGFYKGVSGTNKYEVLGVEYKNDWNIGSVGLGVAYKF